MSKINKTEALRRVAGAVAMNGFERAIAAVAPSVALKRAQSRAALALSGAYVGGSKSRKATQEWVTSNGDADSDLLWDLPTLRERSRDLERNSPLPHGAIKTNCLNVIGPGLKLRPQLDRAVLGLEEDEADEIEEQLKREWRLFWQSQEVDSARICSGPELEWLGYKQTKVNGEVIVLFPRIDRPGSPYSTKVQLVEADRLCNKDNATDTDALAGGVQRDSHGAPTHYHLLRQHPGKIVANAKGMTWDTIPAYGSNTGLRNVLHIYRVDRPGQSRGIPYLAPVIEALKQIGRYTEAEIDAAVLSAFFTVFIKTTNPDGNTGMGMGENGALTTGTSGTDEYKLGKGSIIGLGENEDISTAAPGRPNQNFDPFVQAILRQIGVALGLPFEVLIKHFTASYSAARAALLEAWKYFITEREWWALKFNQAIYEIFLYEAVSLGRIHAPGFFDDALIRQAWCQADWIGPAKGMINENDELDAAKKRVDMTITTLDEETAQLTGGDWETKFPQRVKESKRVREAGLDIEENKNAAARDAAAQQSRQQTDRQQQDEAEDEAKEEKDEERQQENARMHRETLAALAAIPAPVVNVAPAQVSVEAPQVHVAPAPVNITNETHLHPREKDGKTTFEITRDDKGRPSGITEKE